jgi:hypothetical protein
VDDAPIDSAPMDSAPSVARTNAVSRNAVTRAPRSESKPSKPGGKKRYSCGNALNGSLQGSIRSEAAAGTPIPVRQIWNQ